MLTELEIVHKLFSKFKSGILTENEAKELKSNLMKLMSTEKIIGWISFIENDIQQLIRIHNNYDDLNFIDFIVKNNIVQSIILDLKTGKFTIDKDYFLFAYFIPFEKPLINPHIDISQRPDLSTDYTVRDYFSAWRKVIELISIVSPELTLLITDRNSPDYLFLDALAFLYDRLQFYIDFATNLRDPEKSTGEYLDLIARFWGLEIFTPQPSKLNIPIVFRNEFIAFLISKATNIPEEKILNLFSANFGIPIRSLTILFRNLNFDLLEIKKEIKTTNGKAILNNITDFYIDLSNFPRENPRIYLEYKFVENKIETKTLNLDIERTIEIEDRYIDLESVKIDSIYKEDEQITNYEIFYLYDLVDYNKVILRAKQIKDELELSKLKQNIFFVPIYLRLNRYGELEMTILDSPLEDVNLKGRITFVIKYSVHKGAYLNDSEFDDKQNIKILEVNYYDQNNLLNQLIRNAFVEIDTGTKIYTENLKKLVDEYWFKKHPSKHKIGAIIYSKLDENDKKDLRESLKDVLGSFNIDSHNHKSFGGTSPLTDDELRNLLKIPINKEFLTYSPIKFFKRAVNELDYEVVLKFNKFIPILTVKINFNKVFPEEIQQLSNVIVEKPVDYHYIPIFPFVVDIFILGKEKYLKTLTLTNNRQETVEIIRPRNLLTLEIKKLVNYLNKFRLSTHYIRLYSNIKITEKRLKGVIYTSDIDQVKKALIEAQNLLCLRTEIGETITPQKINSILLEKLPTCILDLDYETYPATENEFIYVIFSDIIVKDIILYESKKRDYKPKIIKPEPKPIPE